MKKILCTLMIVVSFVTANAVEGDAQVTIPIKLQVVDGLKLNKSGDIDFGDVVINKGEVVSDPITLTATRSDSTAQAEIEIKFPKTLELTGQDSNNKIDVFPVFSNANGVEEDENNIIKKIDIAADADEATADIQAKMMLKGYETADDYEGTLEVTATIK